MDADGRHFQLALEGPAVERLDVLQFVAKLQVAGVELVVGQGVEHEGIVGIGTVADGDEAFRHDFSLLSSRAEEHSMNRTVKENWM